MKEESSNKRIAKNTLMLYIRMLISMLVGLYTSRVVLQTLGVEDYGIYGVVGGVVSMMGFLNASMSGATSRFITFELGKGDMQRVRDTFSSAMIIHIGIALVVILLAETVGLWFLCNKLVIPEWRMEAAHWVYQCSIISAAVGITQSPYTAVIMSREKMDVYAYMELLNVSLKLGIVYLLVIGNFDKLILYAILTLVVSVLMAMLYRFYCIQHYEEGHFRWVWDKEILKPMMSFSGWNMYGKMCGTVRTQGTNFVINMFFGVALNAATSVATTLQGIVEGLATNVTSAMTPQIVKSYANKDYERFNFLLNFALTISSILLALFVSPMIVCSQDLLNIWLGAPPEYSVIFAQLLLISSIFGIMYNSIYCGLYATGQMRNVNTITGSVLLLSVPILYLLYRMGMKPEIAQILSIISYFLSLVLGVFFLKSQYNRFDLTRCMVSILKICFVIFIAITLLYFEVHIIENSMIKISVSFITNILFLVFASYYFLLNSDQKQIARRKVMSIFAKYNAL